MSTDTLTATPLLAVGALLLLFFLRLTHRRPHITSAVRQGVRATIAAYTDAHHYAFVGIDHRRIYPALTRSRDGLAVALLLLNAAAKSNPPLYGHKVALLRAVVDASRRADWWTQVHTHPLATTYTDTFVVYVETTIGPILDISRVQLSVHISAEDVARSFPDAPDAQGRGWAGIALQARAEEIAQAFLQRS